MLDIAVYSIIILLAFFIWYLFVRFFSISLEKIQYSFASSSQTHTQNHSHKVKRISFLINFILICFWVFFASYMFRFLMQSESLFINLIAFDDDANHFITDFSSFYTFCLILISCLFGHILSTLDYRFLCVPNILLFLLFIASGTLYYSLYGFSGYAFMILGVIYSFYFCLHLFSVNEILGIGDIWVLASFTLLLESFFQAHYEIIFEALIISCVSAIFYSFWLYLKQKNRNTQITQENVAQTQKIKIPFIPFLLFGLVVVSCIHAA
ncbi:hypothetical protein CQA53_02850 [Helicobacter didelphidarum]|uniref:Prepilin type IV endopeptidase peptidase domain-containing protein n=1 Tax=Helicobacter didelphidarum TaxID=2040648 RepID=A0A3D8IP95_9HELI|nr:hypothetical protein [Helicobacter didelphidarum]RDU66726.1 hypothetical protein CQA53_02850 [Helicobacter didelphidarum]